jgi:hypothetical protein
MGREQHQVSSGKAGGGRARRLLAGLRVTEQDEALLAVVRPFLSEVSSEGELAYRLWRRGLELTLAEVVGLGAAVPSGTSSELIAQRVAQHLLLCLPLLRRTGMLALLEGEATPFARAAPPAPPSAITTPIDETASVTIASLGGSEFL